MSILFKTEACLAILSSSGCFAEKVGRNNLSLNAFKTTQTELKLIAAEPIIGLKRIPNAGNKAPAATGIPNTL